MPGPKYVSDFEFPSSFGFTKSGSGKIDVVAHTRQPPQRFARGGHVKRSLKPTIEQVVGGTAAAGLGAALLKRNQQRRKGADKRSDAPKPDTERRGSIVDAARGTLRRRQERELGLSHGGTPRKYAGGGRVNGSALVGREKPTTELDKVSGGKTQLRPGFKKGGSADMAQDRKMVKSAIAAHVRAPKPRGHGVKKAGGGKMC